MSDLPVKMQNKTIKYFSKAAELEITRRHLPHWAMDGVAYFITFKAKKGEL